MSYITYAVPFFVLALLVELAYGLVRGRNTYRLDDAINSLALGTMSRLRGVVRLGVIGVLFGGLTSGWTLFNLPASNPWVWLTAFVAYDFCYYLAHRYGHEWRILWASHVVHHQSEEYNLSTALRQTSTGWLNSIFYLPLFILGIPVELIVSVGSLNLIYQFWVHTQHVKTIGWLEWILVTPSNHRVHHAKNPGYIDRNYGGVFIVWDRLLGTFTPEREDEPCVYGITDQLNSWNPLWANLHVFYDGLYQSWQTPLWRDKLRLWFKSPAWIAPGVAAPQHDWRADKFAPAASLFARGLSFAQFVTHIGFVFTLLAFQDELSREVVLLCAAWLMLGFYTQGLMLEARSWASLCEMVRVGCGIGLIVLLALPAQALAWAMAYLSLSAVLALGLSRTVQSDDRLQLPG